MNLTCEIEENETILDAALKNDIPIRTSCGGIANCCDCIVVIKKGEEFLSQIEGDEKNAIGNVFYITKERLACQTFVKGNVITEVVNIKKV